MDSQGTIYLQEEIFEQPFEPGVIKRGSERRLNSQKFIHEKRLAFFCKRIFDICFSFLVILLVLTWVIPIIALLIKVDSRGPVFFFQKRIGKYGLSFTCFKFRTMFVNENEGMGNALIADFNITGIGRFLRQSNLDELPQFFNVLLGNMSIVGPRPHVYSDCRRFSHFIADYNNRNVIKPGITGLAQVKGYHGPVSDPVSMFRRYHCDMMYIKKFNLLLDMSIVCKTAWQRVSWLFLNLFQRH